MSFKFIPEREVIVGHMKFSVPGVFEHTQDKIDELFTLANLLGYQRDVAPLFNAYDFIEAISLILYNENATIQVRFYTSEWHSTLHYIYIKNEDSVTNFGSERFYEAIDYVNHPPLKA